MIKLSNKRLLFDFWSSELSSDFVSHSKGPTALVLNDRVRIYFSTNKLSGKDSNYVSSHIRFADFDLDLVKAFSIAETDVISLGETGTFDEHGIFPFTPFIDSEENIYAYLTGWSRRVSVSIDCAVGLSISLDSGKSFKRIGSGPVLSQTPSEPFLIADPFPLYVKEGRTFVYYIYGDKWVYDTSQKIYERVYRITMAMTSDFIKYERKSRYIVPVLSDDEVQAYPTVMIIKNTFHMLFCYRKTFDFRENKQNSYKLGYAFSSDGLNWVRDDSLIDDSVSLVNHDDEMMAYPCLFRVNEKIHLLYNGNSFGKNGIYIADVSVGEIKDE